MTVSSQTSRIEQLGDGATTAFAVNFYFLENSDLKVFVNGVLQTITTNYTVTGAGNPAGGTVTFVSAPANGVEVVIFRDPAITQGLDYIDNDPFPAESHERGLDKLTMIAQRVKDLVSRALRLGDSVVGVNTELPALSGGQLLGTNPGGTGFQLYPLGSEPDTAANIVYTPAGTGAVATTVEATLQKNLKSITDFGLVGDGSDESSKAIAMIAAHNYLYVPPNFTLVCKNIELFNGTRVICEGTLKLPDGCVDFDRLLFAANKTDIEIDVREIDGNYANQSGSIGTHLVYLTGCDDASVKVKYAHDHFVNSGAPMTSVDGIRNASSGAIFIEGSDTPEVQVGLLEGWGREGIYLLNCQNADVTVGHCQGKYTTEYSGLQVSGQYNQVNRVSVDNAGASGVGFDTTDGVLNNVLSTNTREQHGVNFGHLGLPASRSVASNIVVDGCFVDGIKVSASTVDLTVDNFSVKNAGRYGISVSDSSVRGSFSSGVVSNSGQANIQVSETDIRTDNVKYDDLDPASITVTMSAGTFVAGETITAPGPKSATVRKVIRDLTNAEEILFLTGVSGSFAVSDVVTGGTSGAVGTVSVSSAPVQRLEQSGGRIVDEIRLFPGSQDQIRFPDGTAILTTAISVVVATAGTLTTVTTPYSSNVLWASAPRVVAQVASANSTGGYNMNQLESSSTATDLTLDVIASVAQTYGISVIAIGRWK